MGFIKNILPRKLYNVIFDLYQDYIGVKTTTYSSEGEDLILKKIFAHATNGFFVDIGAYHPITFSNTYYFYKKGWTGINIDPNPKSIQKFEKLRKRDTNLNIGVSDMPSELVYYMFEPSALNTFSEKVYQERIERKEGDFLGTKVVQTLQLNTILGQHLPSGQKIDFMSIDVEGLEMQVLKSNDWDMYRPSVLLVEEYNKKGDILQSEVYKYCKQYGYTFFAKTFNTFVFVQLDELHFV